MARINACAIFGVAVVSITITALSPTTAAECGSPSAVKAHACLDNCVNVVGLAAASPREANSLLMLASRANLVSGLSLRRCRVDGSPGACRAAMFGPQQRNVQ